MRILSVLGLLVSTGVAWATTPTYTRFMCNSTTLPCAGGSLSAWAGAPHVYDVDRPVRVYAPTQNPRNQLVVFLHGCCGDRASDVTQNDDVNQNGFLTQAVSAGYHVIALDYDNTRESVTGLPASYVADDHLGGTMDALCGCNSDCYAQLYELYWHGTAAPGLRPAGAPAMAVEESIDKRLLVALTALYNHNGGLTSYDHAGDWAQFLLGKPGTFTGVDYTKVVIAGHSLGSNVAGYIAKQTAVARAVLFAGAADTLDREPPVWPWGYDNNRGVSASCSWHASPLTSPAWVTTDSLDGSGTDWHTGLSSIFALRGACDQAMINLQHDDDACWSPPAVCNNGRDRQAHGPFDPAGVYHPDCRVARHTWDKIGLQTMHQGGGGCAGDGYGDLQGHSSPWCHRHGLILGTTDAAGACVAGSYCGAGHSSVLGGQTSPSTATCSDSNVGVCEVSDPTGFAQLQRAWCYVLLEPTNSSSQVVSEVCDGRTCVDLLSDANHCGACGNSCPGGEVCVGGSCVCGTTGHTCAAHEICTGGTCQCTIPDSCGACGHLCDPGFLCTSANSCCEQCYCNGTFYNACEGTSLCLNLCG
jgi:Stigma-specific protein, Stig1